MSVDATAPAGSVESRLVQLRTRLQEIDSSLLELATIGETRSLNDGEDQRWDDLVTERDAIIPEYRKLETRAARTEEIRSATFRRINGLPDPKTKASEFFGRDVRTMDWRIARDGALTVLEDRENSALLSASQKDFLDREVRSPRRTELARRIIVTENDAYRSAFFKMMTRGNASILDDEERTAMLRYEEYRAAAEGTTTLGGFAIPVKLAA
jgi:hypothetical protein